MQIELPVGWIIALKPARWPLIQVALAFGLRNPGAWLNQ
jgi:hypothetical protein